MSEGQAGRGERSAGSGRGTDLRSLLIEAALGILDDPDMPLDLRKVAEAANKSRTAPYVAFGKESEGGGLAALRMAVAAEGARMLTREMEAARAESADPRFQLNRVARALLAFATEHPRLFRLMFGPEIGAIPVGDESHGAPHPEFVNLVKARTAAERVVSWVVRDARELRILPDQDPLELTMGAWALMIGVAFLLLDRVLHAAGVRTSVDEGAELVASILSGSTTESLTRAALALLAAQRDKESPGVASAPPPEDDRRAEDERRAVWRRRSASWVEDLDAEEMTLSLEARPAATRPDRPGPPAVPPSPSVSRESEPLLDSIRSYTKATETIANISALRRAAMVASALSGARVLWVDDHPRRNAWERRALEELGVEVERATSTHDALERLSHAPYDLIISDIQRDGDPQAGVTALPMLRVVAPETPVIFYVRRLDPSLGIPEGAVGITSEVDDLLHLVLDVLERRRL